MMWGNCYRPCVNHNSHSSLFYQPCALYRNNVASYGSFVFVPIRLEPNNVHMYVLAEIKSKFYDWNIFSSYSTAVLIKSIRGSFQIIGNNISTDFGLHHYRKINFVGAKTLGRMNSTFCTPLIWAGPALLSPNTRNKPGPNRRISGWCCPLRCLINAPVIVRLQFE